MKLNKEEYERMKAALTNILQISSDPFSKSQARYGLGIESKKCVACNGSGYYDNNGSPTCGACDGTGVES